MRKEERGRWRDSGRGRVKKECRVRGESKE